MERCTSSILPKFRRLLRHNGFMGEGDYRKLSDDEVASRLGLVPAWSVENGMLFRLFEFGTYAEGVMFAAAIGQTADAINHHPDILIGYRKVRVQMCTHDAGNSLTPMDFELAARIDAIAQPK